MRFRRGGFFTVGVILLAIALSGCTTSWYTWGNGNERHGENIFETTLTPSSVPSLTEKWSVTLGRQMNATPILVHGVDVNGTSTDLLYTGTEDGDMFAVSTAGNIVWKHHVGSVAIDCTEMYTNGVHGVSASAVFDRATNRVYVPGGDGYVYALDASTGNVIPGWPILLTSDPTHEVVWSAPSLVGNNLYVEVASHCDSTPYHGRIVDIDPQTHTIIHTFYVTGSATGPDGGGIWGWGGAAVDAGGDLYVATGNSFATPENTPYGESIVRLSSSLVVKASHTPTTMIGDDDFGSTPVLFQAPNCPAQLVVLQKNGSLYLYDRDAIASGPRQRIAFGNPEQIGVAAYSSATHMVYALNHEASSFTQGVAAFRLDANCKLALAWNTFIPTGGASAPIIAGDVLYTSGDFIPGQTAHHIYALQASTGKKFWDSGNTIQADVIAEPIVVDGHLYAVAYDGKLHCYGL